MIDILLVLTTLSTITLSVGLLLAYRRGLQDGKALAQGDAITPVLKAIAKPDKTSDVIPELPKSLMDDIDYINGQGVKNA